MKRIYSSDQFPFFLEEKNRALAKAKGIFIFLKVGLDKIYNFVVLFKQPFDN